MQTRRIANAALIMNILAPCAKNRALLAITTDAGDDDGTTNGNGSGDDDNVVAVTAADGVDRTRRE